MAVRREKDERNEKLCLSSAETFEEKALKISAEATMMSAVRLLPDVGGLVTSILIEQSIHGRYMYLQSNVSHMYTTNRHLIEVFLCPLSKPECASLTPFVESPKRQTPRENRYIHSLQVLVHHPVHRPPIVSKTPEPGVFSRRGVATANGGLSCDESQLSP